MKSVCKRKLFKTWLSLQFKSVVFLFCLWFPLLCKSFEFNWIPFVYFCFYFHSALFFVQVNHWSAEHTRTLLRLLTPRTRLDMVTYLSRAINATVVRKTPYLGQKGKQRPKAEEWWQVFSLVGKVTKWRKWTTKSKGRHTESQMHRGKVQGMVGRVVQHRAMPVVMGPISNIHRATFFIA